MNRSVDVITSFLASGARLGLGRKVSRTRCVQEQPFDLYDFEGCPFCRRVREVMSVLDLDAYVYPCPKGGTRFRAHAETLAGGNRFPVLVDPATGSELRESREITAYLVSRYGDGRAPLGVGVSAPLLGTVASACRAGKGLHARPSTAPREPLELYSFEASPYCRIVREVLCELEIPYLLHNVAVGSRKRDQFRARAGKVMVPYLVDPNTGRSMFESADIAAYLEQTYGR